MQFYVMTRTNVRQFTLVHVAKCHSTTLIMYSIVCIIDNKNFHAGDVAVRARYAVECNGLTVAYKIELFIALIN